MIADELDLQCKRVDFSRTESFNLSVYSKLHWFKHHYIDFVSVDNGTIRITLHYPRIARGYIGLIQEFIRSKIQEQINRVKPILQNYSIFLNDDIQFIVKTDSIKRAMPSDVQEELRKILRKDYKFYNLPSVTIDNKKIVNKSHVQHVKCEISQDLQARLNDISENKYLLPSLFNHPIPKNVLESADKINIRAIINLLNHIHFSGETILISLQHHKYKDNYIFKAVPNFDDNNDLTCCWTDKLEKPESYILNWIILNDGQSIILVSSELRSINNESISLRIKDEGFIIGKRKIKRFQGKQIEAELIQKGIFIKGSLLDFSPLGFRIRKISNKSYPLNLLNTDEPVLIKLIDCSQIILYCECNILRQANDFQEEEIVVLPDLNSFSRFPKKNIRPVRHQLSPTPKIIFEHPLSKKIMYRKVHDISLSGVAIDEVNEDSSLIPGMIIPELFINFANLLKIKCKSQVIYRKEIDDKTIRCGIAFLDMDIQSYKQLAQLIISAEEPDLYISNDVDVDALWECFFASDFMYPEKYNVLKFNTDRLKEVYRNLYVNNPQIIINYVYEVNGKIYAHISLLRAYDNAWLLHHHIARPVGGRYVGIEVLKDMLNYINGIYHMETPKIDYIFNYYDKNQIFSDRLYSGFAREHGDNKGCSLEYFAYFRFKFVESKSLSDGWLLRESTQQEMWELDMHYRTNASECDGSAKNGMLIELLGLPDNKSKEDLKKIYSELGFERNWRALSLIKDDVLKAVFIINHADVGLNLSGLLNSTTIIIIEPVELSWEVISIAINQLKDSYNIRTIPIMLYPLEFAQKNKIPYEKVYCIWILNLRKSFQDFLSYLNRKFRFMFR